MLSLDEDRRRSPFRKADRSRRLARSRLRPSVEWLENRVVLSIDVPATTTILSSSLASSSYDQSVTFTAVVATAAGNATGGTVDFFDGSTLLGSKTLAGGTATYTTSSLAVGSHSMTAIYSGVTSTFRGSISEVTPESTISTVAGTGVGGYTGDGSAATSAELELPYGVAYDSAGNLFIADSGNNVIREVNAQSGIIRTVAGNGTQGSPTNGAVATSTALNHPQAVAIDAAGDIYIADTGNDEILEVNSGTGHLAIIAGTGIAGFSGDGGQATDALLDHPTGVAVDAAGNIYIADAKNNVVREVNAQTGIITSVAGNYGDGAGYTGDGGPATAAELNYPVGVAVDAGGDLFIADYYNNVIREVTPGGTISTVAGEGPAEGGDSGDGGPATAATLYVPASVAVDGAGNLYIGDLGNGKVRMVAPDGIINTLAGTGAINNTGDGGAAVNATFAGVLGVAVSPTGQVAITSASSNVIRQIAPVLPFTVSLATPTVSLATAPSSSNVGEPVTLSATVRPSHGGTITGEVAFGYVDASGVNHDLGTATVSAGEATYTTTALPAGVSQVWARYLGDAHFTPAALPLTSSSTIVTFVGPASSATLDYPYSVAFDAAGDLYIADTYGHVVKKVTPEGVITTVAGTGTAGYSGDGGPASLAELWYPTGVAVDAAGDLYIADYGDDVVRRVDASTGVITTVAGDGAPGYSGDFGPATLAQLFIPTSVAVDAAGDLYIADSGNNLIRMVTPNGIITTVAGDHNKAAGYSGDGGLAVNAQLNRPFGVAVDTAGNLYIGDSSNNVIRMVAPDGIITTIAGNNAAGAGYSGNGGQATSAQLNNPNGTAVDTGGNLYIADWMNSVIRVVAPDGIISTLAGNGTNGYSGDGGPASAAELNYPPGLAFDAAGDLYIADEHNNVIREVIPTEPFTVSLLTTTVSLSASSSTLAVGQPVTLAAIVTAPATAGTPTGSVTFFSVNSAANAGIDANAVTPVDGTVLGTASIDSAGEATLTVSSLPLGMNTIYAQYVGDSSYASSTSVVANVLISEPTQVTNVLRYGFHAQSTTLVINFDGPLTAASSDDVTNYKIVGPGGRRIKVRSAIYDAATHLVLLKPAVRLNIHRSYMLTINGSTSSGLTNPAGLLLDGAGTGQPGSNYVTSITWRNLAGTARQSPALAKVHAKTKSLVVRV